MDLVARAQRRGSDVAAGLRFVPRLPSFLRRPFTIEEARATLRRRLEHRGADFLWLARRAIYEHAASPYRALLNLAGCEYGDLERMVTQDGVEATLRTLYHSGVYLSVEEFKGRRPVVRGQSFLDTDVIRVLEEVLPARFGGALTDYQLVEEEGDDGRPAIRLLVSPSVGPLDPALVVEAFLTAVAPPSSPTVMMGQIWRDAGVVRVERRAPLTTDFGKVLHLHVRRP